VRVILLPDLREQLDRVMAAAIPELRAQLKAAEAAAERLKQRCDEMSQRPMQGRGGSMRNASRIGTSPDAARMGR
jgi:hypothetical protein